MIFHWIISIRGCTYSFQKFSNDKITDASSSANNRASRNIDVKSSSDNELSISLEFHNVDYIFATVCSFNIWKISESKSKINKWRWFCFWLLWKKSSVELSECYSFEIGRLITTFLYSLPTHLTPNYITFTSEPKPNFLTQEPLKRDSRVTTFSMADFSINRRRTKQLYPLHTKRQTYPPRATVVPEKGSTAWITRCCNYIFRWNY